MQIYNAVVESIDDPLMSGRVKVRVFGLHTDDRVLIPTEDLPWAQVMKSTDSAAISGIGFGPHGLVNGSWVKVGFEDPELQYPWVLGSILGISSTPSTNPSQEEISFGQSVAQTVAENNVPVEEPTPSNDCEANTDLSGFYSKFGKTNPNLVLHACCDYGITNPFAKIAILANVAKECAFVPKNEVLKYSVARARQVFPTKTSNLSDTQLEAKLATPESTGNFLYGGRYGNSADEGYKYRGRGFIQITFKANYAQASKDVGVDFVSEPDKLNLPDNAAKSAVKFIIREAGGLGVLNGLTDQDTGNRVVTQAIGGKGLNLRSGIGADLLKKVIDYSNLGKVTITPEGIEAKKATPIGNKDTDGSVSDGLSSEDRVRLSTSKVGFRDPSGKYPLQKFINEPDTNRLTRRNTADTSFQTKKKQRKTGIKSVTSTFDQPMPPYNAKYPYNRGYFSESGHSLEFDDTEGQERVSLFHKSGTFTEIDNFGNRVNRIIGSDYTIVDKNGYLFVDGNIRITCGSTADILIEGNANFKVDGSLTFDVGGDYIVAAGGNINLGAGGAITGLATESVAFDGYTIELNSGLATQVPTSSRDAKVVDHPEILGESKEMGDMISNDDVTPEEAEKVVASAIASGVLTKSDIEEGKKKEATVADEKVPDNKIEALPGNCSVFLDKTNIPGATVLSKYFTLADLTTKVALPSERREVAPNAGLSVGELVCNLKKLAENCLDPIKQQFPDLIITNTIRRKGNASQHERAMAADTQYTTASSKDYFEIAQWIKDNVIFDQLLLEYRSGGRPWIHVSYTDKPRRQVMTFMNHSKYKDGLHQLG